MTRDFTLVVSFGRPVVGDFTRQHELTMQLGCTWQYIKAAREYRIVGNAQALAQIAECFQADYDCSVRVI